MKCVGGIRGQEGSVVEWGSSLDQPPSQQTYPPNPAHPYPNPNLLPLAPSTRSSLWDGEFARLSGEGHWLVCRGEGGGAMGTKNSLLLYAE